MAKELYKKASQIHCKENWVVDCEDILFEKEYNKKKFFGIIRPNDSKSIGLVKIINYFGYAGGFDLLLERIKNEENRCSLEIITNYIYGLGNIW